MYIFLRAKHWQLFLLTFGIPMLLQIVLMFCLFLNFRQPGEATVFNNFFRFSMVIMPLFMGVLFGW